MALKAAPGKAAAWEGRMAGGCTATFHTLGSWGQALAMPTCNSVLHNSGTDRSVRCRCQRLPWSVRTINCMSGSVAGIATAFLSLSPALTGALEEKRKMNTGRRRARHPERALEASSPSPGRSAEGQHCRALALLSAGWRLRQLLDCEDQRVHRRSWSVFRALGPLWTTPTGA